MDISENILLNISHLLRRYIAETMLDDPEIKQLAIKENALPLFIDIGGVYAIRTNGEVIVIPWKEDEGQTLVIEDKRIRNTVLFQGSKRYPELERLTPVKALNAQTCPVCHGTGIEPFSARHNLNNIVCYCGGLGWVP